MSDRGINTLKIMIVALIFIAVVSYFTFGRIDAKTTKRSCIDNQRMLKIASTIYQVEYEVITTQLSDLERYSGVLKVPTPKCRYEYIGNDENMHAWRCKVRSHDINRN